MQRSWPRLLDSAFLKVEWAKQRIKELDILISEFGYDRPYVVRREDDVESGELRFILADKPHLALEFQLIAGEIVHHLRSSLDHLAYRLVLLSDKSPDESQIFFPISYSRKNFIRALRESEIRFASRRVKALIRCMKPYHGGNEHFFILNELSKRDKHRFFVGLAANFGIDKSKLMEPHISRTIGEYEFTHDEDGREKPAEFFDIIPSKENRAFKGILMPEVGEILIVIPASMSRKVDYNFQPTFAIAFSEPDQIRGEPLMPTLSNLAGLVQRSLELFVPFFEGDEVIDAPFSYFS